MLHFGPGTSTPTSAPRMFTYDRPDAFSLFLTRNMSGLFPGRRIEMLHPPRGCLRHIQRLLSGLVRSAAQRPAPAMHP
jgi:hypothetical protein